MAWALVAAYGLFFGPSARAAERQVLKGHVPAAARTRQPMGRLGASTHLGLAIGLPLRNQEQLASLLQELYRPGSPSYHQFLTPEKFATSFGPTEKDYQAVIDFAIARGLKVTGTHSNRALVDVDGSVDAIEQAFHVNMGVYQHPTQARTFFAPNAEPAVDLDTPLLAISGLNNYTVPHPCLHKREGSAARLGRPLAGSGNGGSYMGKDFRAAYVPGVSLTGAGQSVGLFELVGYKPSDISAYETEASLPSVTLSNILIDGFNGGASERDGDDEVCLDIEAAIAMAPGLSSVLVYEASPESTVANINDLLNRMATDGKASQLSCSWIFDINVSTEQIFQQYAAQGQSFFKASGDYGAFSGAVAQCSDDPYITVVGGSTLSTTGPGGAWVSETTWNSGTSQGSTAASSGGISITFSIPTWQEGISMVANQGSTTMRNAPDVAMLADNVWVEANGQGAALDGTSIATPLWAAFTALVNEQAAARGQAPVGFVNPAIYAIGKGTRYTSCFHDITTGNNTTSSSPNKFYAVGGYDLCTGWGSPNGSNLIQAMLAPPSESLVITPPLGFTASGPVGGPFNVASLSYLLTNAGSSPLNWSLVNTSPWLTVSPPGGILKPGGPAVTVTAGLNSDATNLLIGNYDANVWFTNLSDGVAQIRAYHLLAGNGGFETGDFSDWTLSGNIGDNFAISTDESFEDGGDEISGVDDSQFVHSGLYGAFLGQPRTVAYLSQTLPTIAGRRYLLSFWLTSFLAGGSETPSQFVVSWNGTTLLDESGLGAFGWTNMQYVAPATSASATLEFGAEDYPGAFGLDDVSVQAVPAPSFQSATMAGESLKVVWSAIPGLIYQVQYTTNLALPDWTNVGPETTATSNIMSVSEVVSSAAQIFYRVVLVL